MSGDFARLEAMVEEASGIIVGGKGKVKIIQAMALVGFTSEEQKSMKLYQQVRRHSSKLVIVKVKKHNHHLEQYAPASSVLTVIDPHGDNVKPQ